MGTKRRKFGSYNHAYSLSGIYLDRLILCISIIIEGELLFSLAKRLDAKAAPPSRTRVSSACRCAADRSIVKHYGTLRAAMERQGKILAPLDQLIATHPLSVGAVLVTNDQAFCQVANLSIDIIQQHIAAAI